MYSRILSFGKSEFPKSFLLLQQEAFLANTSLLSGFEYLIKGYVVDTHKGAYYAAFFDLSIGIERLFKLALLAHSFVESNFSIPRPINFKNKFGHRIYDIYSSIQHLKGYETVIPKLDNLNESIVLFLQDFAEAKNGRYYNIEGLFNSEMIDPLVKWEIIMNEVKQKDFSLHEIQKIETKTFNNININLQIDDIAFNTGYVNSIHKYHLYQRINRYILWRVIEIVRPIVNILDEISKLCHIYETKIEVRNMPSIPYFNEIFLFCYTSRESAFRKKQWTSLALSQ